MSVDEFAIFMTAALGILSVTTNVIIAYLFKQSKHIQVNETEQTNAND